MNNKLNDRYITYLRFIRIKKTNYPTMEGTQPTKKEELEVTKSLRSKRQIIYCDHEETEDLGKKRRRGMSIKRGINCSWTVEDDQLLIRAVKANKGKNWKKISEDVPVSL